MPEGTSVEIRAAKGRPMLTWVGKRPLCHVTAYLAQHIETYDPTGEGDKARWPDWPTAYPPGELLFHGDNKEVLAHLLANGFRGYAWRTDTIHHTDIWANNNYLQFIFERLLLPRELLDDETGILAFMD